MHGMFRDWGIALLIGAAAYMVVGLVSGHGPAVEGEAPAFAVRDSTGRMFDLEAQRGGAVIVSFWASWCAVCKEEAPELSAFAAANPHIPVIGLAVDSGEPRAVMAAAEKMGISFPVAVADPATVRAYGVEALPTTVIIDASGQVIDAHVGLVSARELVASVR